MHYQSSSAPPVTATVIIGGPEGRTLHRPEVCLPGQGWKVTDSERILVDTGEGSRVAATLLTLLRSETAADGAIVRRKGYNIYWYVGKDRTAATYNRHITASLLDGMFRNLYHRWSMVSIFASLQLNESENPLAEADTVRAMQELVRRIVPHIREGSWAP